MPDHSRSPVVFSLRNDRNQKRTRTHADQNRFQVRILLMWSGKRDLNPRHLPWQGNALPLSYSRILRIHYFSLHNISYLFHKCKRFYARFYKFFDFFRKIALIPLTNRWHTGYNNKNLVTQGENYVPFECMVAWIIRRSHKRYVLRMLLSRRKAYRKNDTSIIQDPTVCFV